MAAREDRIRGMEIRVKTKGKIPEMIITTVLPKMEEIHPTPEMQTRITGIPTAGIL